jgi:CBS domain-containing membrane protein
MKLRVRDLMTDRVFSIHPDEDLARLVELMDDIHVRHVPVVDTDHTVVGLVSQLDLIRSVMYASSDLPLAEMRDLLKTADVRSIMTTDIETIEADADIEEAAGLMLENKLGCLPVVEGGRLTGILTEADFVKYVAAHATI